MVRFKNRYLVAEMLPVDERTGVAEYAGEGGPKMNAAAVAGHLRQGIAANFGQLGVALTSQSLSVKYCNSNTGLVIVRAPRDHVHMVWASITLLTTLPPPLSVQLAETSAPAASAKKAIWSVIHSAGTIRSAQKQAIRMTVAKVAAMSRSGGGKGQSHGKAPAATAVDYDQILASARAAIAKIEP